MKLSEIIVIKSDALPVRTMCVSPDVFELLTSTPDAEKEKAQLDNLVRLSEWIKQKSEPK